ncbi:hypothetical protein PYV02_14560 [Leifsonia sp. H3M29-4]|jgi:hypothetical protein|uniref:hypothetical protein n=1 Tax=Salinibacterium metalliresistens TaxID=3031321 RepID=UPI0023D98A02|nr:hypothetical protein [Salinibacterium metalliresistens]MDF1480305.1 hypothetical protein [Salinibacterium metalliresistens]
MIPADLELAEGEALIAEPAELLFRQITQHMISADGQIGSLAFAPSTADQGKPSFSRSSLVSPQDARDWHSRHARSWSLGVRAVSISEVTQAGRIAIDDSQSPLPEGLDRAPGHCFVDFRGLDRPERKAAAAILLRFAIERGEIPTTETPDDGQLFVLDSSG